MARYTTPNQFANMLEARATDLEGLADRIRQELADPATADALDACADQVLVQSRALRQKFRGPNPAPVEA